MCIPNKLQLVVLEYPDELPRARGCLQANLTLVGLYYNKSQTGYAAVNIKNG